VIKKREEARELCCSRVGSRWASATSGSIKEGVSGVSSAEEQGSTAGVQPEDLGRRKSKKVRYEDGGKRGRAASLGGRARRNIVRTKLRGFLPGCSRRIAAKTAKKQKDEGDGT